MSNRIKLYNVIFPFWMLFIFPIVWLFVLPGNFIIDSLVFVISMLILKIPDKKLTYKKHIFKIFCFGLLSDLIGAAYMFLMVAVFEIGYMGDELYLTIPAIFLSSVLIFVFNFFITFKKCNKSFKLKQSLIFAIVTAPYTFLIPTSWIH